MNLHSFILILEDVTEIDEALETRVYEAGCDDALLGMRDGKAYLDFDRDAPTFDEAFSSAVASLKAQGLEVFPSLGDGDPPQSKGKGCCRS